MIPCLHAVLFLTLSVAPTGPVEEQRVVVALYARGLAVTRPSTSMVAPREPGDAGQMRLTPLLSAVLLVGCSGKAPEAGPKSYPLAGKVVAVDAAGGEQLFDFAAEAAVRVGRSAEMDVRLVEVNGGSMRNAIPREAEAKVVIPKAMGRKFKQTVDACLARIRDEELAGIDDGFTWQVETQFDQSVQNPAEAHAGLLSGLGIKAGGGHSGNCVGLQRVYFIIFKDHVGSTVSPAE